MPDRDRDPRAAPFAFALLLVVSGCSCGGAPSEVRWPASPDGVSLADELLSTAEAEGRPTPLSVRGTPIDGEPLPDDAPGIRARAFVFDGLWVGEVVLGEAAEDAALPLVVMLHGRGDRPRIPGGPFGRVPTPIRVIVPRGPLALGRGFAWTRRSVTERRYDALGADLVALSDRLVRLVRHVRQTRPSAGTPIVTGFSQGAMLAWTLAVRHPDDVGLVIPVAGWVPPAARPAQLRAPTTRAMHGTADPIVRIGPTRAWVRALRDAGNEVDWVEYPSVEHVVSPEMNARFEAWLEAAAEARAPGLAGGLGERGADPEPVEPYEPAVELDEAPEEAVPAPLPEEAQAQAERAGEAPSTIDDPADGVTESPEPDEEPEGAPPQEP